MIRIFRSQPSVYEQVRAQLDAAYGYPNVDTKTETAIPPADELPHDSQGRVYLAISAEYCDYILPSEMLPTLIAAGSVEEIDADEYQRQIPG